MASIEKHLHPDEEVLYVGRPTFILLLPLWILAAVFVVLGLWFQKMSETGGHVPMAVGLGLAAITAAVALARYVSLAANRYVLTSKRLIKMGGILTHTATESYLEKINNVEYRQTLWGRMLNFGDLEIDTASETGMTRFIGVTHPLDFKRAILAASDSYRAGRAGGAPASASPATQLRELKALLDDGLVSPEEYEAKRKALLERM